MHTTIADWLLESIDDRIHQAQSICIVRKQLFDCVDILCYRLSKDGGSHFGLRLGRNRNGLLNINTRQQDALPHFCYIKMSNCTIHFITNEKHVDFIYIVQILIHTPRIGTINARAVAPQQKKEYALHNNNNSMSSVVVIVNVEYALPLV